MSQTSRKLSKLLTSRLQTGSKQKTSGGSLQDSNNEPGSSKESLLASVASTTSPYFSPRRTRSNIVAVKSEVLAGVVKLEPPDIQYGTDAPNPLQNDIKPRRARKHITIKSETAGPIKFEPPEAIKIEPQTPIKTEPTEHDDDSSPPKQSKWQPTGWEQALASIRRMRELRPPAPVDTMGCHKCHDPLADPMTQRYHILVALMLSSQTKDQVTYEAMRRLRSSGQLTAQSIVDMDSAQLEQTLCPVSFYRNKAKYLQQTARILVDRYGGDIPASIEELIALPGVGPKMAHICMQAAWNVTSGIGVDTHVHRIANRLRWTRQPTANPEQTRVALEQWLPAELWSTINTLLVGFGQTVCTPLRPKCDQCEYAAECPSRGVKK